MTSKSKKEIVPVFVNDRDIGRLIHTIRGVQVMLDYDLAVLYGYEVKRLNEQVKRNISRFPEDFMFQLRPDEIPDSLKSQFATLKEGESRRGKHIKKMPYAFTEQGIYMLATVLKGDVAEQQSIFIMRAFREMRHYIQQNRQFVTRNEWKTLNDTVVEVSNKIHARQDRADSQIIAIRQSIDKINENFVLGTELKTYVIYKGQKFEADKAYIDIYQKAQKSIYVIDNYVNIKTLHLLSHKRKGVSVILFTENGFGRSRDFLTPSEIADFDTEYPTLQIKPNPDCHDRFIVLDYGLNTERVFFCGASSKDAGNKVCTIDEIADIVLVHPVIDKLLSRDGPSAYDKGGKRR